MRGIKALLLGVWLLFINYSLFLAPVEGPDDYFMQLITFQSLDPLLVAVFSLLGVYPLVFAILLLENDKSSIPAWPFSLGAFFLGAFSLLPYFAFHNDFEQIKRNRTSKKLYSLLRKPSLILILGGITIALFLYGTLLGNVGEYAHAFQTSRFVHVMTIDFVVLTFLSILGIYHHSLFKNPRLSRLCWLGSIPILGALFYLYICQSYSTQMKQEYKSEKV